jgi:opacity protein-like surface antigen
MQKFFTVLIGLFFFFCVEAHAQTSRLYFAGYLGLTAFDGLSFDDEQTPISGTIEPDNSTNFAGALGLRFTRNFRMEAEFSYRDADFGTVVLDSIGSSGIEGDIRSSLLMINGYYDFDIPNWQTQPFLSGGIGIARHQAELFDPQGRTQNFTNETLGLVWSAGGGLKYRTSPNFAWTGSYRFIDGTDLEFDETNIDYSSHEFRIGLEYDLAY